VLCTKSTVTLSRKGVFLKASLSLFVIRYLLRENNESAEVCGHLLPVTYLIKPFDQA